MGKDRFKLFLILWAGFSAVLVVLMFFFIFRLNSTDRSIDKLQETIDRIEYEKPKDGINGASPTMEDLVALIEPLIPEPVAGKSGKDGLNGKDGGDGKDSKPCTTYTEGVDSYIACPDGTKTLIRQPDEPRQVELCSSLHIPLGWRYVGSTLCQKVRES